MRDLIENTDETLYVFPSRTGDLIRRTGYVALYRVVSNRVEVLAVRHHREVGYR